jgi:hypothetical protein
VKIENMEKIKEWLSLSNIFVIIKLIIIFLAIYTGITWVNKISDKFNNDSISKHDLQAILDEQNRKFEKLAENIVVANTQINSKLLKEETEKLDKKITDRIDKNEEKIFQIGTVVARTRQLVNLKEKSDKEYKGKKDKDSYFFKKLYGEDVNGKTYDLAWVMYYPNRPEEERWKYGVYGNDVNIKVVQTEQLSGAINNYSEAYITNDKIEEMKGKEFPINIAKSEFIQKKITEKSWMFVPAIDMGASITSNGDIGVASHISLFGYGRSKKELDWRFCGIGMAGNDQSFWGEFYPFSYNIGHHIPLMSNLWIHPIVSYNGKISGGAGISVRF